jgi:hypothetical protein
MQGEKRTDYVQMIGTRVTAIEKKIKRKPMQYIQHYNRLSLIISDSAKCDFVGEVDNRKNLTGG